ncbi:MAG: DUF1203 domain-containing protein [Paracoccaceae bacterium]
MPIAFAALPTEPVRALQAGGPDAYGHHPERQISDGDGVPCRHCLRQIPAGAPYLVLAYRPFASLQPYAETGPIFLCAAACPRGEGGAALPEILDSPQYMVRGYGTDERIRYGTGRVVATAEIPAAAEALLADPGIAFVHVRSASNNCFQVRIERA